MHQLNVPILGDIFLTTPSPALASSTMVCALVPPIPNELTPPVLRHVLGKLELGKLFSKSFRKMRTMKCWLFKVKKKHFVWAIVYHRDNNSSTQINATTLRSSCLPPKLPFLEASLPNTRNKRYTFWAWPPSSNKDQQNYYSFTRESL